ncbi:hypothetical protein KQ3_04987 [Bacillus cereus B5-2]|nr:hypothetical protein ICS_05773 [Bacillus cereus BAG2O-3]EOQ16073.1 hypothetical protein KQ3_04987 [Bacillus cereus B5-2]
MTAYNSSTQVNGSKPARTVQKGVQQHVKGKSIVNITEAYKEKLNGLETVKGKGSVVISKETIKRKKRNISL